MTRSIGDYLVPLSVAAFCAAGLIATAQLKPQKSVGARGQSAPPHDGATAGAVAWKRPPEPGTALTRIGFGSCLVQSRPQPIWEAVIAARPQAFLMMGDNVYGDFKTADGAKLKEAYEALSTAEAFRRAAGALPMLATWDDHDYGLNDGGADFAHKAVAQRLFEAFWTGSGTREGIKGPGIAYAREFGPDGRRVQIIMLDTRSFRSALKRKPEDDKAKGRYVPDDDAAKTMLGDEQWAWLEQQLKRPADLRLVVSSIQVIAEGHRWERWGNLVHERRRLMALIDATGARNIVFLSGDRHRAGLYQLAEANGPRLFEATSSSLNRSFPDPDERGPHQIGAMFGENNFGMVEIDWAARLVTVSIRDQAGAARLAGALTLDRRP